MNSETIISSSPEATYEVGKRLAPELREGNVLLLYGGLGAGKTLFTKGLMDGLGYDVDEVTSPSFALVNRYDTESLTVFHIDLWRLEGETEIAEAVGLEELLEHPNSIVIIEWADRLGQGLPMGNVVHVRIEGDGDEPRYIGIER